MVSRVFKGKRPVDRQKLRGGYYTPKIMADFLVEWAIRTGDERILEPSCGDGNFIISAIERIKALDPPSPGFLSAVEIDEKEINKATERVERIDSTHLIITWLNHDFFRVFPLLKEKPYDVIIGNPPFIRFQHFDDASREIAFSLLREVGYRPTKLANAWAAFLQLSIELLATNGRLAMVIPAELLQVIYAKELRERITRLFEHIILISFKNLVFPDIQQEVVLLLAEGKRETAKGFSSVHTLEIYNEFDLAPSILSNKIAHTEAKHTRPDMKWTSFFLDEEMFNVLDITQKHSGLKTLGDLAAVDVGVVTGRNSFFVVDHATVKKYDLSDYIIPLVGKTAALGSILFTKEKYRAYSHAFPGFLLDLRNLDPNCFNDGLKEYISLGEKENVNTGYKCRIRKQWYEVPSIYVPDGFLFRQIHRYPILVVNEAGAVSTDTIHRVRKLNGIDFSQLSASFINSLTFAWSEISGRSYGGGVLELEPSESENLPVPFFPDIKLDVDYINSCLENKSVEKALDYVDDELLKDKLSFTADQIRALRSAWQILSERRINRKKSPTPHIHEEEALCTAGNIGVRQFQEAFRYAE